MKEIKKLDEIEVGKVYKICWEEIEKNIKVNKIFNATERMYKNSIYLNNTERVDLSEMEVYELNDEDKVNYCREKCVGCGYCSGCLDDGNPCDYAPSIEIIKQEIEKII
jgi:ferredoxin-like protein FixX